MSAFHRTPRLMLTIDAAALSLDELRQLDEWLHERIAAAETEEIPQAANRVVVEERKDPTGTYRLELVKCGKDRCKRCVTAPAHGPYWYMYWKQGGRTRSKYIGKTLPIASIAPSPTLADLKRKRPLILADYRCGCTWVGIRAECIEYCAAHGEERRQIIRVGREGDKNIDLGWQW